MRYQLPGIILKYTWWRVPGIAPCTAVLYVLHRNIGINETPDNYYLVYEYCVRVYVASTKGCAFFEPQSHVLSSPFFFSLPPIQYSNGPIARSSYSGLVLIPCRASQLQY